MKSIFAGSTKWKISLAGKIAGFMVAFALSAVCAWSQPAAAAPKPEPETIHTIFLTNVSQQMEGNEITTAIRNVVPTSTRIYFVPSKNAIIVRGTADQIAIAEKTIKELDQPKKSYRLTYTFTDMDGDKAIGTRHFSIVVISGQRTTAKQGSKLPIMTGSTTSSNSSTQTQVTYLDVGLNLDVLLDEMVNGVRLHSKVEQSSVAEQTSGVGSQDPIIRQAMLEGTSFLMPGKPLLLGSLDIPGSTRHLDIAVMMEPVK